MDDLILDDETLLELFTRYINRKLREDKIVKDWAFTYSNMAGQFLFVVRIDYIEDFHSRDMFDISEHGLEYLKLEFDIHLDQHKRELEKLIIEKAYRWGGKHD